MDVSFDWQLVRIGSMDGPSRPPYSQMFTSVQQLEAFCDENRNGLGLAASYGDVDFEQTAAAYDESFFENSCLLLVFLEEGSGSTRIVAEDVTFSEDTLTAHIARHTPEASGLMGTADMAYWAVFLALDAKYGTCPVELDIR